MRSMQRIPQALAPLPQFSSGINFRDANCGRNSLGTSFPVLISLQLLGVQIQKQEINDASKRSFPYFCEHINNWKRSSGINKLNHLRTQNNIEFIIDARLQDLMIYLVSFWHHVILSPVNTYYDSTDGFQVLTRRVEMVTA